MLLCGLSQARHRRALERLGCSPGRAVRRYGEGHGRRGPEGPGGGPPQLGPAPPRHGRPGDVKAEVVPLAVHHAQSSPVVIQPSQLSSALLNPAQHAPGGPGPHPASAPAATQEAPSALPSPHMPGDSSSVQSLFIEEIHSVSARSRAVSIEVGPPSFLLIP